jgi:hypothetical protein
MEEAINQTMHCGVIQIWSNKVWRPLCLAPGLEAHVRHCSGLAVGDLQFTRFTYSNEYNIITKLIGFTYNKEQSM